MHMFVYIFCALLTTLILTLRLKKPNKFFFEKYFYNLSSLFCFSKKLVWTYEVVWISYRPSEPVTGVRIPIGPYLYFKLQTEKANNSEKNLFLNVCQFFLTPYAFYLTKEISSQDMKRLRFRYQQI